VLAHTSMFLDSPRLHELIQPVADSLFSWNWATFATNHISGISAAFGAGSTDSYRPIDLRTS
jgi:hypothetical protein